MQDRCIHEAAQKKKWLEQTLWLKKNDSKSLTDPMLENRELMVHSTLANELKIINTLYKKTHW
jgi:hypothetical protein